MKKFIKNYALPITITVVFVVLRLCGVIHWSWWWVISPIWINCALGAAIGLYVLLKKL